jgi:hypothetical protein
MENSTAELEKRRVREVAKEYRQKGYEVIVHPEKDQLPPFLSNYKPDLIARSEDETVVLEIKSHFSLSRSDYFSSLAENIKRHPGYRFELVVTNPKNRSSLPTQRLLSAEDIFSRISDARALVKKRYYEAALLLSWATAEGALRLLADREDVSLERLNPSFVIKQLTSLGLIPRNDYRTLERGMELRNAVIHGFRPPKLGNKDIETLLNVIERILN